MGVCGKMRYLHFALRLFALLLFPSLASSQAKVTGFAGDNVILPCSYNEVDNLPDITFIWRTTDDGNVYDVFEGRPNEATQDSQFKNRITSFPNEYNRGNFSLLLKNPSFSDAGKYDCFVPEVNIKSSVDLTIKEKVESASLTTAPKIPNGRGSGVCLNTQYNLLSLGVVLGQMIRML